MTRTRDPGFPGFAERLLILLRGIAALTGLALMTAGFPAAMFVVAPRLDLSIPTWTGIVTTLTRPDDGTLFLRTLAVIAWAAWAAFLGCVVLELGCLARRIATPTLPALGWPQAVAASLIAAIVVMLMPTTRATAAPARPGIVATAVHTPTQTIDPPHPVRDQHIPSAPSARPSTPGQAVIEVTVQDGDTLWDLAERHLGHGPRYADIADLNYGRPQPDGRTLTHSHWLTPGWKLLVPDETPPSRHPATSRATSPRTPNRTYVVQPHDTLWDIAEARLGDGNRYREIAVLNLHRPQPDGGRLTDVDLIQPGWILQLPPAAVHRPTRDATGQTTSQPDRRATPEADRQATAEPDRQATAQARPSDGPQVSRSQEATASPSTTTAPSPTSTPTTPAHATDAEGIHLNGSFITWTLASAITSAIALAWLQRRRRYNPEDPTDADDDPTTLPEPLPTIHHDTLTHADTPTPTDLADRAADVPPQPHPTTGGLGLIGDGADAAARAALIAALSAGGPRDPDRRTEVVIDRPTLTRLLTSPDNAGPVRTASDSTSPGSTGATEIQPWPRLHLADTPDDAVSVIEAELLRRARILDDDQVPDLATLRIHVPDEEPLPPILLITPTPTTDTHARIRAALTLGASMDTTAVLLGPWDDGITLHITADGHATPTTGHGTAPETAPDPDRQDRHHDDGKEGEDERIAVLDPDTTAALLVTLREAHTGEPPANGSRTPPAPLARLAPTDDNAGGQDLSGDVVRNGAVPVPGPEKAQLRVLGIPEIVNVTGDGKPLRSKALELAVFLACHPDGADTRTIGEYLAPDSRLRQADQHVHTNVSNLRHVLGRAAGARKNAYVIKDGGRYRLDPASVDVDLWHLQRLLARATATTDPTERARLLRRACTLYTGPLADNRSYDWIETHRERVRRQAVDAHLRLAALVQDTDPHEAADLLDKAITIDPFTESLYRHAMTARHRIGDRDGIHRLHRALTAALDHLDAEPDESTNELVQELLANPARR